MFKECEGCSNAHNKITHLEVRVSTLETIYQIFPNFEKQNKDKIEIIKEVQKIRLEMVEELSTVEHSIKKNTTDASKMNYRGLKKVIEKE